MRKDNNIFIIVIIIFAFIQVLGLYYMKSNNEVINFNESNKVVTQNEKHKTLKEFNDELKEIDKINILEGSKSDGKWYMKVSIEGQREEILECLSYLKGYAINDYVIEHNKDKSSLIIELSENNKIFS
ncbi:hypothetical protein UT300005_03240 [Clostridium sp. CTA-5]